MKKTDFLTKIISKINPQPAKEADYFVDYLTRLIIFLFPLYIYKDTAFMGISYRDILIGILILLMALRCAYKEHKSRRFDAADLGAEGCIILAVFLLTALLFFIQFINKSAELSRTYLYMLCFLIFFCMKNIGKCSKYYMQLIAAPHVIIYLSIYVHIFTGKVSLLGVETLLDEPKRLVPVLLLGCGVCSVLYILENEAKMQKVYLAVTAAGMIILFLYGEMVSFVILLLFIMCLQFFELPTAAFMKKNMIILFLFGFCASNAPLLAYFNAPGIGREFDLEYSIYIDIVIAVLGLVVTGYWDRLPKEHDEEHTLMLLFSSIYKRSVLVVTAALAICFVFGERGGQLSNAFGGKALTGLSTSLWNAVKNSEGELWHILKAYGIFGAFIIFVMAVIFFRASAGILRSPKMDETAKGCALIACMFMVQGLFYPYSSESVPTYMVLLGLTFYMAEHKNGYEIDIFTKNKIRKVLPYAVYTFEAALAAMLLILVVIAAYKGFAPMTDSLEGKTVMQSAIERYEEALLSDAGQDEAMQEIQSEFQDIDGEVESNLEEKEASADDNGVEDIEESQDMADAAGDDAYDADESETEAGISGGDYRIYDPNAEYSETDEMVTGRNGTVNLRSAPDIGERSEIVHALLTGESAQRIAVGKNGWSKVIYEGRTLYAVTEYLVAVEPQTDEEAAEEQEAMAQEAEAGEDAFEQSAAAEESEVEHQKTEEAAEQSEESKETEKPKGAAAYSVQWAADNKKCTIWSAGVLQGSMTITDSDGKLLDMTYYGIYYHGSGRTQKKYFYISVPQKDSEPVVNVDGGFVDAIKAMGYDGLYLNKTIHNW